MASRGPMPYPLDASLSRQGFIKDKCGTARNGASISREPLKIQDYGIIGDCRAAALMGRDGSLDWLCWTRFDSPAIFAALLDPQRGGYWRIAPLTPYRAARRYVAESNVIESSFTCSSGAAVLTDLMSVASEESKRQAPVADHEIPRQIRCVKGELRVQIDFQPRKNYGLEKMQIRLNGELGLRIEDSNGVYWLRCTRPLSLNQTGAHAELRLQAGEQAQFSLSHAEEAPAVLPCLGEAA